MHLTIVGGGLAGLVAAVEAAERGLSVRPYELMGPLATGPLRRRLRTWRMVGTRAAGASTAMLLARPGIGVLAVDLARFPSDTLSARQVQVPGVAVCAGGDSSTRCGLNPLRGK
jgi:folate-dependent tRNA-U54 methylase TrmFO/GidA